MLLYHTAPNRPLLAKSVEHRHPRVKAREWPWGDRYLGNAAVPVNVLYPRYAENCAVRYLTPPQTGRLSGSGGGQPGPHGRTPQLEGTATHRILCPLRGQTSPLTSDDGRVVDDSVCAFRRTDPTEAKNAEVSARAAAIFQSSRHPRWPTHSRPQAHPAAAGLTHNPHSRFYSADLKHHASPERTATFLYDRARNGVVIPSRMFRPDRRSFESAQATNGSSGWLQKMSQLVREHDVFCRPP